VRYPIALSFRWVNRDGKLIILARGINTFARSSIAVMLALYLEKLGFSLIEIGVFLSVGVAGSAFFAFLVSFIAEKVGRRRLLVTLTLMSAGAGLGIAFITDFLPLLFLAFLGCIPGAGAGAVGPLQPLEQASLPDTAPPEKRTDLFAIYRIVAVGGMAFGALAAGLPPFFQDTFTLSEAYAYKAMFLGFAFLLLVAALLYGILSSQ